MKTQKQLKEIIKEKLSSNPKWSLRALTRIYQFQTDEEIASAMTVEHNSIGFSAIDAEILTSFAEQIQAGRTLTQKQMQLLFKKMPKYWRQIMNLISPEKLEKM